MYIPKSKYSEPKYTRGREYSLPNGDEYKGWYVTLYNGQVLSGKQPTPESKKLSTLSDYDDLQVPETVNLPTVLTPTQKDYTNGFFFRYFIYDSRTKKIKEVKLETYRTLNEKSYNTGVRLRWNLTSPGDDLVINGYRYTGSGTRNQQEIDRGESIIPGLKSLLNNPKQFVL